MEQRGRLSILLAFILFAACLAVAFGPARTSAAINYIYQPPAGWQRTTYLARGLGTWANPRNDQTITVSATNYAGDISSYTRKALGAIQALPGAKVGAAQQTTVCSHHPASYIAYEASRDGKLALFETMLAVYNGVAYDATYVRAANEPSLGAARMSLTTLCGGIVPAEQNYSHAPQPYRTAAPATPNLGPLQSSQPLGTAEPTVTPYVAPTVTPALAPTYTPGP